MGSIAPAVEGKENYNVIKSQLLIFRNINEKLNNAINLVIDISTLMLVKARPLPLWI